MSVLKEIKLDKIKVPEIGTPEFIIFKERIAKVAWRYKAKGFEVGLKGDDYRNNKITIQLLSDPFSFQFAGQSGLIV